MIEQDAARGFCVFDTSGQLTPLIEHDLLLDPGSTRWSPFAEPVDRNLAPNLFANTIVDLLGHSGQDRPLWIVNLGLNCRFLASAFIDARWKLTQVPDFLLDATVRAQMNVADHGTRRYWAYFEAMSARERTSHIASTYSMFATLLLDDRISALFQTRGGKFSLADISKQRLVVRLPVREFGQEAVAFIGSLMLAYINVLAENDFAVYVDDCDLFANGILLEMATRGRFRLCLAHQYLDQLNPKLLAAILGNPAERYIFRVSSKDANILSCDLPPNDSKVSLDQLGMHRYRTIPFDRYSPDGRTFPLEN
ncbi:hypothetical protein JANAI62_03320 [Jannaschia pagri]|uniref:Uncharacterized protein n=2 Tax=Roseobacteraceae TaxID=2854170 RepID=A0ABQ4NH08_9RHOB|nr:hypothetical protein JANAI61_06430 [Jannaschia sp. AI_61]GIT93709.1 hypothetical protein JANAI62_03320 [Jannaschia sp. AI_62]